MERKYLYEINFVRAFACLMVVMVHVSVRFYYAYDGHHTTLTNFLNQISRVGTPLFAVLSGFLLYNQTLNKKFNTLIFLKSRFVKIISPFVFWSLFYLVYKSTFRNYSFPNLAEKGELSKFMYMFFTGGSQYHLYFIALVIQFYILFLLIRKLLNLKSIILFTVISFYLNYTFTTNSFSFENPYLQQFINSRAFLMQWIYYFMLGILLVKLWPKISKYLMINKNSNFILLLGSIVIILSSFDYHMHQLIINSNVNFIHTLSVPVAFMVLVSLYYRLIMVNEFIVKALIKIGNMSMGIYLIHPFVIYLYQDLAPYDVTAYPALISIYFIMVIVISILILKLLSFLPFNQYIVTLVKNNNTNIDYNIKQTQELIKKSNPEDFAEEKDHRLFI